jgi:hypothetical protein
VYENGEGKNRVCISRRPVDASTVIQGTLPAAGGHSMRIVPE